MATTRMFVALMRRDGAARELVTDVLSDAFPWVKFLPRDDVQAFVVELVSVLRAAESIENPAPVVAVIEDWRHTAMVFADPALAAVLAVPQMTISVLFRNRRRGEPEARRSCGADGGAR